MIVKNKNNELIPTKTVMGWCMCINYRKLNEATRKDYFSLPFIDQMLERLVKNSYFCYLDGYLYFFQIRVHPSDQENTTFTCPYGTYAYRRMSCRLWNSATTFQRCMMTIFFEFIKDIIKVSVEDFFFFGCMVQLLIIACIICPRSCKDVNI